MSVLSIDAGTTGIRAIIFDEAARPVASSYREFPQHFPRPGWVEHDLDEIWDATTTVLSEALGAHRGTPVSAVGITNQRETACAWSRSTSRPLARAIVWQDRRTARRCEDLREAGFEDLVRAQTGLVLDPYFTGSKFEWLLTEGGVVAGDDLALGTIDTWIIWKLTGGKTHATDWSNAARTMLFDLDNLRWSSEMCDEFGVPISALPEALPSCGGFGLTDAESAAGLEVTIGGVAGDQQAALFGQACLDPGMAKNTYGTGSFVLLNTGETRPPTVPGLLTTIAWGIDGLASYAYEGSIFSTGSGIQWLRDGLGIIGDASEAGPLAESVADTGGVCFVPAFNGLGSPWWDPRARGLVVGLTRGSGKAEITRAVIEAMAYQTRDVVDAMASAAGVGLRELRVDGGASVMDFLCQFQADQLGLIVRRPVIQETTALGAAYLAGLAAGVWGSTSEIKSNWAQEAEFSPGPDRSDADRLHERWLRAVKLSMGWSDD